MFQFDAKTEVNAVYQRFLTPYYTHEQPLCSLFPSSSPTPLFASEINAYHFKSRQHCSCSGLYSDAIVPEYRLEMTLCGLRDIKILTAKAVKV